MPKVYSVHGFSETDGYEYTEGLFYTIGTLPQNVEQKRIMSSGRNVGIFEDIATAKNTMKEHIKQILSSDLYDYVSIGQYESKEDDYYFCFSGPGKCDNKYIIDGDDVKCIEGDVVL